MNKKSDGVKLVCDFTMGAYLDGSFSLKKADRIC
jgi:hypothetical protein